MYKVNSIFGPTIQGEGSYMGMPCLFIRFSGCNKWSGRPEHKSKSICHFCDTDFLSYTEMTADEITSQLYKLQTGEFVTQVILSGGEPTLQIDESLLKELASEGYVLHLETNGSNSIGELSKYFKHISMSPKQSYELTRLEYSDDIKFLYPYLNNSITPENFKNFKSSKTFLQPLEDSNWKHNQTETIRICLQENYYLSMQLHKVLNLK